MKHDSIISTLLAEIDTDLIKQELNRREQPSRIKELSNEERYKQRVKREMAQGMHFNESKF